MSIVLLSRVSEIHRDAQGGDLNLTTMNRTDQHLNNAARPCKIMAFDPLQLIIIGVVVIVVLLWGPKKIPELARSIGLARKEFQAGAKDAAGTSSTPSPTTQSSVPKDDLIETARKLGISTEGKTRQQISDEIVKRVQAYS
jgi:sec-independent protein translocase protein TatA